MRTGDLVQARFRGFVLPILLMFVASATMRWSWRDDRVVSNIDASYHVLLTVRAMSETPASVHHFLPIVTLGRPLDRDVPFGSAVRGPGGVYYYTSFPPLGFVAPWAFFRVSRLAPTVDHLMLFNMGIHLVATLLLALLVMEAVSVLDVDRRTRAWIVLLSAATYLFTFEALYSHGIVYWHHSLFQVVWLLQLVMAARVFRCAERGEEVRRFDAVTLVVCGALGPAIEWTGYLATASIAGLCWWRARHGDGRALRRIAVALVLAAMLAGLVFVAHFTWVIGLTPLLDALRERAGFRSAAHGSLFTLASGYVQSFGALLVLVVAALAAYAVAVRRRAAAWMVALLLAAILPLSENVLLAQHAATYHFDRLKALVAIVLVSASVAALLPPPLRRRAVLAWLAVLICNLTWTLVGGRDSRSMDIAASSGASMASNASLLARVHRVARPCAVFATDAQPRAWVDLSLGSNTYGGVESADSVRHLVAARRACQGIYMMMARAPGAAVYVWRRAIVLDGPTGAADTLEWSDPRAR